MTTKAALLILSTCSIILHAADKPEAIIGALEEVPGHYAGEPNFRGVRVLFQKRDNGWQSFPSSCPDHACLKTVVTEYPGALT